VIKLTIYIEKRKGRDLIIAWKKDTVQQLEDYPVVLQVSCGLRSKASTTLDTVWVPVILLELTNEQYEKPLG